MPVRIHWGRAAAIGAPLALFLAGCEVPMNEATATDIATRGATDGAIDTPKMPAPMRPGVAAATAVDATFAAFTPDPPSRAVTIAPLVNGTTGEPSAATREVDAEITKRLKNRFPLLEIAPFTAETVARKPYVLAGTLTPRAAESPDQGSFMLCLALRDLANGRQVARSTAPVADAGVNAAPTAFFRDSPVWIDRAPDEACPAGDDASAADPSAAAAAVATGAMALEATIAQAVDSYESGRMREAETLFRRASAMSDGTAVDALNGLYLTAAKLGRRDDSVTAFAALIGRGLEADAFAIKLRFRPISTGFVENPSVSGAYDMWLAQIARHAASRDDCLLVAGHAGASDAPALDASVSLARAHVVQAALVAQQPVLRRRVVAIGADQPGPLAGAAGEPLDGRITFRKLPACAGASPPKT